MKKTEPIKGRFGGKRFQAEELTTTTTKSTEPCRQEQTWHGWGKKAKVSEREENTTSDKKGRQGRVHGKPCESR